MLNNLVSCIATAKCCGVLRSRESELGVVSNPLEGSTVSESPVDRF